MHGDRVGVFGPIFCLFIFADPFIWPPELLQVICSFGRSACRSEDRFVVALKQLEPVLDVRSMPEFSGDCECGREEGSREFSDKFFGGIGLGAKAA